MATTRPASPTRNPRKLRQYLSLSHARLACALAAMSSAAALGIVFYRHPVWVIDRAMQARLRLAGIRSEYVTVGPHRVHYFVGGEGKPLLLIHGLGARSEDWTPQMPAYAKNGFRVYAVDLLGYGRTDRPDIAYSIGEQVDLIDGFLSTVHIEQTDVTGWSMGGWVALEFALRHPERVRRLVAMDSAGLKFQTTLAPDILEPSTLPQLERLEAVLMERTYCIPSFIQRDLLRAMERNRTVVHRALESLLAEGDGLSGRLSQLRMPVLLVWGAQDRLMPPSIGLRMHEAIPQFVLELYSGCGHLAPATCARRIVPKVLDFLHSQPPMAGGIYRY
ncbi:MAG: alpha/beta fold hydrolase [Acidobacteriaceae bacterium]